MINLMGKILNRVLVWNVLDHKGSSGVITNIDWSNFKNVAVVIFEFISHNILRIDQNRLNNYLRLTVNHHLCLIFSIRLRKVTGVPVNSTGMTDMTIFSIR